MQYNVYNEPLNSDGTSVNCSGDYEKPYSCSGSFGNPSFHALSCTAITIYLLLDFLITREELSKVTRYTPNDEGSLEMLPPLHTEKATRLSAAIILLAGLLFSFSIGLLRYKFGTTYMNQLVLGWLLGLWLACLFAFVIRLPFYNYIKLLLEDRQEINFLPKHMCVVGALTASMMLICVIQYYSLRGK